MERSAIFCLMTAGFVAMGCGGLGEVDTLFGNGGASATVGGAGGAPTTSSASGGAPATSSTSAGGATASSASSSAASSSTASASSASSSSSASSASSSASASSSSSSGGGTTQLDCAPGDAPVCPFGGQNACCWDNLGHQKDEKTGECVFGPSSGDGCFTATNQGETRIECQSASQCPGQLCCAHRSTYVDPNNPNFQQTYYDTVSCEFSCNQPNTLLCEPNNPNAPCPVVQTTGGPVQFVCKQSQLLPTGYWICGQP